MLLGGVGCWMALLLVVALTSQILMMLLNGMAWLLRQCCCWSFLSRLT